MGFWLLIPGVLMGGSEPPVVAPTGAIIGRSEMPVFTIAGSQQPALTIPGM